MLKLELKRIFSKKINVFAIGLALILAVIFSGFAVTSNRYVDENGNASTGIMATRKLTDNRRAWKGTLTEDELGKVIEQNKNAMTQSSEENAIYGTTLQPIDDIRGFIISVLTPDAEYDESVLNQITEENIQEFYEIIYIFLTIFLYLLKCPQSLILSALRAFCFCGKPHISRSIFLYFRYQAWLKSW